MNEPELDALHNRVIKNIPMCRSGGAAEIAKAVIFLSSEQ